MNATAFFFDSRRFLPPAAGGLLLACSLLVSSAALAQSVKLAGIMGGKALVVVDASAPKSVAAGESHLGVKVVSTDAESAVVEVAGRRHTVRLGDAPISVGGVARGGESAPGSKIVMTAGNGGHFFSLGQINGQTVQLMVDTGATSVGLSLVDAMRIGLSLKAAKPVRVSTANGVVQGWKVTLDSMRVGDVEVFNVEAVVSNGSMPFVLLGNSFLNRFSMTRSNDQMVLVKSF